ncbi:MAG: TetR/AcrR family transcriptional regulator [candidate division WOR-3 bacterium]|nr:TetR/AcrR family transcriptional regulator [candidate division WOR-3 bacterium]
MLSYNEIINPTDERVRKILQAGERHFERLGVRKASIDEICADADISKPTFYKYFDSKQALFFAVRIYTARNLYTIYGERSKELKTAAQKLVCFFKLIEEFSLSNKLFASTFDANPELRRDWIKHPLSIESYLHRVDFVEKITLEGIASDEFRSADPRALAHVVITSTFLIPTLRQAAPEFLPKDTSISEFVFDLLLNGIKK